MNFDNLVRLIEAIAWPVIVLAVALIFRRQLPELVQALGGRISRLSVPGVTFEFAAAEPAAKILPELDKIREPTSTGPPPPSGVPSLIELAKASSPADYVVIDLRDGQSWLTSRLYLFAVVLPLVLALRCFVFVGARNLAPRYFLGLASPESVARGLENRYPWLRQAKVEVQLHPLICSYLTEDGVKRYVAWPSYPNQASLDASLRRLIDASATDGEDLPKAEALNEIVRSLLSPIDLLKPGEAEEFVGRFLENPNLRRPHNAAALDENWVHLSAVDEHAHWIEGERNLLDLLGDDLRREYVGDSSTIDDEILEKAVLRKRGSFVAITDPEGRFTRLIDRGALIERVAAGKHK
jgi:hypothetical protein